jgi:hypothetical protein
MASALRAKSDEVGSVLDWSGMAFGSFMVRRDQRIWLASWCHCAAALGNPELSSPSGKPGYCPSVATLG